MNRRRNNKKSDVRSALYAFAVVFLIIGIFRGDMFFLIGGIVLFAVYFFLGIKINNILTPYGQVKSGSIRAMSVDDEVAEYRKIAAASTPAVSAADKTPSQSSKVKTYNVKYDGYELDKVNPNECPICKKISANGYCSDCGYKFRS